MEVLNKVFDFLVDNNRKVSVRAVIIVFTVIAIYLLNDVTGFTYYHNTKSKIEQIKALAEIAHDTTLTKQHKEQILALETEILERKTIPQSASEKGATLYRDLKLFVAVKDTNGTTNTHTQSVVQAQAVPRNNFLFLITASGLSLLLAVLLVPVGIAMFFSRDSKNAVLGASVCILIILIFAYLCYGGLDLIPMLGNTWTWNYILNSFIQVILCTGLIGSLYSIGIRNK